MHAVTKVNRVRPVQETDFNDVCDRIPAYNLALQMASTEAKVDHGVMSGTGNFGTLGSYFQRSSTLHVHNEIKYMQ